MIKNPILKGFNPDPSIIRIGDDYYIATSTFEWWPGVQIHHSCDLVNWTLHSRPLNRVSQLDMTGIGDSCGIWAPCMTYDNGTVYLVYTVTRGNGVFFQTDNYLVTTNDINGEWSEPVYLNSFGFDPSMFHDDDGRRWLLNLDNHYKKGQRFNGLWLQEYDEKEKKLLGKPVKIYENPATELVEGSHIYKLNGYYYLLKAQGGTGKKHSAQLSRSESLFGPYEDCPHIVLHSRNDDSLPLQKAGHADIVQTKSGEWYMVHLASRMCPDADVSILGREGCIQKVEWTEDGWLRLSQGGENPHVRVECDAPEERTADSVFYDFKNGLPLDFQSLRVPIDDLLEFDENGLTMTGCEAPNSLYKQSLIARRVDEHKANATTAVDFEPEWEKHMAGLICIYDTKNWYYLYITRNNNSGKKEINVIRSERGAVEIITDKSLEIEEGKTIYLSAEINGGEISFFAGYSENEMEIVSEKLDLTILSDEKANGFTGTMIGLCCQDLHLKSHKANFKYFRYGKL